jgi:hypothetical protein
VAGLQARNRSEGLPLAEILLGLAVLGGSSAAMLAGLEPFATWFYLFAWYATLLALDGAATFGGERPGLLRRPAHLATLLAWSAVTWLFFELLNLRLRNWYYVFVPADALPRRAGVLLAFATVFPAIFGAEALLDRLGFARGLRCRPLRVTRRLLGGLRAAGVAALVLPLLLPDLFFPLVWVSLALLLDPANRRRAPERSLLGDLERGQPGRLLRLLAAGACVGLLWELYNARARGKWIYTVPGFEGWKLFEMPLAGFLGFPLFALECFAVWQALVLAGLAVPRAGAPLRAPAITRALAVAAAGVLSTAALAGMERVTVSSVAPELAELPGVPAGVLQRAGYDVFSLARAEPAKVAAGLGRPEAPEVEGWIETARLAVFEGIGTGNVGRLRSLGIASVAALAACDPANLARRLAADGGPEIPERRVRGWVRAARTALGGGTSFPAPAHMVDFPP